MPDGTLLVARMDGRLVMLGDGEPQIRSTNQGSGFLLGPLSPTEVILAGSRLSVLDLQKGLETDLSTLPLNCTGISVGSECVFVVGRKGSIGELAVRDQTLRLRRLGSAENLSAVTQYDGGRVVVGGWHGLVRRRRGDEDEWEDISLPQDRPVTGLAIHDTTLLACCGGVYAFDEGTRTWHCGIEPVEEVWCLSSVGGQLLACHTYSGLVSVWDDGKWRTAFPSVAPKPDLE